jgi:hypothetical protein
MNDDDAAPGQHCTECGGPGHVWCLDIPDPFVEPLAAVLANPHCD